ncbi:MAG TPA: hypothetical protein PLC47_07025, partial [Bacteroidales bacterium]|nr:hypothetical protein [Bacteroidales bacterium]
MIFLYLIHFWYLAGWFRTDLSIKLLLADEQGSTFWIIGLLFVVLLVILLISIINSRKQTATNKRLLHLLEQRHQLINNQKNDLERNL